MFACSVVILRILNGISMLRYSVQFCCVLAIVAAAKRGKPVDIAVVSSPDSSVSSGRKGNQLKSNKKSDDVSETSAPSNAEENERTRAKGTFSKFAKGGKTSQRHAAKKFITSTQKWKERKELKKRLQVKFMHKGKSSNSKAKTSNEDYDENVEQRSESGNYFEIIFYKNSQVKLCLIFAKRNF